MTKKSLIATTAAIFGAMCFGSAAHALLFDQDVTPDVIFGSGNLNGDFTVDRVGEIELGLRAKLRHNASGAPENTFNSNGDGTYSFDAGVAPTQSFPTAVWSFEWSVNTDTDTSDPTAPEVTLGDFTYRLGIDYDPSQGTSFSVFDPINVSLADHALGYNSTGNGGGTSATDAAGYARGLTFLNVAQNSWKPHWFIGALGFDPTADGTYDIFLEATHRTRGSDPLARTQIQVIVGEGGAAVPDGGTTLGLLGAALAIVGLIRRRLG